MERTPSQGTKSGRGDLASPGASYLNEINSLSQYQDKLYTRPDLIGLNSSLRRPKGFPKAQPIPRQQPRMVKRPWRKTQNQPRVISKTPPGHAFHFKRPRHPFNAVIAFLSARVFQLRIPTICHTEVGTLPNEPEDLQQARRTEASIMNKYLMQLRTEASVADSIVRECHMLSKQEHILEQIVSIEVGPSGDSWRAVVWLDSGIDLLHSVRGVNNPWTPPPKTRQWQTYFFPVIVHQVTANAISKQGSATNVPHLPSHGTPSTRIKGASDWKASQNVCFLPIHYGFQLDKDLACQDALYALSELFQFAASSEVQLLNCLQCHIEREVSFIGAVEGSSRRAASLMNLRYIKTILKKHAQRLAGTTCMLKSRDSLDWPRLGSSNKAEQTAKILLADFEYLLRRAESLARECEQGMATLANSAILEESRRSVDMGLRVEKLTKIATIFIPLSFVCSVWGMNFQEFGTGILPLWWFPVTAGPILLVSIFIYRLDHLLILVSKLKGI